MKKENEELTKTKFKFGRNPLSFIIIIVSLAIIVFAIVVINSYSDKKLPSPTKMAMGAHSTH